MGRAASRGPRLWWTPLVREVLDDWRDLQDRGGVDSPFLSHEWMSALADVPAVSDQIRVLRLTVGAQVVGLLPLEHWRQGPVRVLGLAGGRWLGPDHVDVVASPGDRAWVAEIAVGFLLRARSWDLLDLEGLGGDGALAGALDSASSRQLLRLRDEVVPAPFAELTVREPTLLLPSRNLRQQVQRGLRTAERSGGGFRVSTDPDEVPVLLDKLMDLHTARFGRESSVFATRERRQFHRQAARRLAENGMARVYSLQVAGEPAALLYALRLGTRLYYYSLGMQPHLGLSPGRTLLGQTLLSAAGEGLSEFDLLRGDHEFKRRFATGVREDRRVRRLRTSPRGALLLAWRLAGPLAFPARLPWATASAPPRSHQVSRAGTQGASPKSSPPSQDGA